MEKILTLFERGEDHKVVNKVRPGCEWVIAGEGVATEKLDGMNIRLTVRHDTSTGVGHVVRVEKRRNPTKAQKRIGIKDPWYVDADADDPGDKYIFEAVRKTITGDWPDGEHCCEAVGPKIQGNPLGLHERSCVPFKLFPPIFTTIIPRTFDGLKEYLPMQTSMHLPHNHIEGIVFHHIDGRMAKIKTKDFKYGV